MKEKDSVFLRFLYGTRPGRLLLAGLIKPPLSRAAGRFLDSSLSARLVPAFARRHHIDLSPYEGRVFSSFNAFFTRERQEELPPETEGVLLSPCDGLLSAGPIDRNSVFLIKGQEYSLSRLLKSSSRAAHFAGGSCLIFRLTPAHYHRYGYCCSGRPFCERTIEGVLHTVRPIATEHRPVYSENSRTYCLIETEGALVAQMEVGALLVGKICNRRMPDRVTAGEEKGYFAFGGSTIIVLLERDAFVPEGTLAAALADPLRKEIEVRKGERLGKRPITA